MAEDGAATAGTAVQLIDGEGGFATDSAERFMATAGVAECGLSYAVVSIMGPQSSGKNADSISLSLGAKLPKDDTAFEKQSALFALAISDIVLINMWCHDIGREQAANKPLLKTVFQIWNSVPKPEAHKDTPLSEFFNVEVTALPSFEEKEEQFREQVMVATVRCDEIANEKFGCLASDAEWLELENAVQSGSVQGFGKKLGYIVDVHMQEYDKEAVYFDEAVRKAKRQVLESRILNADWDYSKMLEKVRRDIEEHAFSICERKLSELTSRAKEKLRKALVEPVESLFDAASQTTWESIRNLYKRETEAILPEFLNTLSGFEMESAVSEGMVSKLRDYARSIVENKAKEEANKVLMHMKERFTTVFSHDKDSMPRVWTGKEDVRAIAKDARSSALKLMSVLAVIRWDDKPDSIENILISTLLDSPVESKSSSASSGDPLASTTWEEVHAKHTLITPAQCKSLWKQFKSETEFTITQAVTAQQAHRRANGGMPPPWAMVAIAILGFNEIMALLRNPIYLFLLFVGYLVAKALAVQLDIGREFQNGMVPGIISVSAKLLPSMQNLLRKVASDQQQQQQGQHQQQHGQQQHRPQAAEGPEPQPPLLLSPNSSMRELRRLHMPPSPVRRSLSSPSHSSSSSPLGSPRRVSEDQKPRRAVEPESESSSAYSIV
ncbi:hypothetical protein ACQ4PT_054032 [Festuca glaucescens]